MPFGRIRRVRGIGQADVTYPQSGDLTITPDEAAGGTTPADQYPQSADLTITPDQAAAGATDTTTTTTTTPTTPATQQQQTATGLTGAQLSQVIGAGATAAGQVVQAGVAAANASPKGQQLQQSSQGAANASRPTYTTTAIVPGSPQSVIIPALTTSQVKLAGGALIVAGVGVGGFEYWKGRKQKKLRPKDYAVAGVLAGIGLGVVLFGK